MRALSPLKQSGESGLGSGITSRAACAQTACTTELSSCSLLKYHQPREDCDARFPQTYKVENILKSFSSCKTSQDVCKTCCNKPSLVVQSWKMWNILQYFCYKSSVPRDWNATIINHCRTELGKKTFQISIYYFSSSKTENIARVRETLGRLLQSLEIISFSMLIKIDLTAKTGIPWDYVVMEFHQIKMLRPN